MLLTVYKKQCERLLADCKNGTCDRNSARFRLQQLTVVRDNADNINKQFVMTLLLQEYRKYVAEHFRVVPELVKPMSLF